MWAEAEILAADLEAAPVRLGAAVGPVVAKGALNIKTDWRTRAAGLAHAPLYPASIGYDISGFTDVTAVIGPDKERPQGALGNLIEFGSAHNPPHLDGDRALAAEQPKFLAALEAAAGDAVLP